MLSEELIQEIVKGTRKVLDGKLTAIVLYGSAARNENGPESDVDIALLVKSPLSREENREIVSLFSNLWMDTDYFFSPLDIEQDKFDEWVNVLPFYRSIRDEGVVLWKAA